MADDKDKEIARLKEVVEKCRQYVRDRHNASYGWWNDRRAYDLIKEDIDPVLGTDTR